MLPCLLRETFSTLGSICVAGTLLAASATDSFAADATPFATIDAAKGTLLFDGKKIDPHSPITKEGSLQTAPGGAAQVTLLPSHHQLFLGPGTRVLIMRPDPNGEQSHLLEEGLVRARVRKEAVPANRPTSPFRIRTRSSIMGVRGTEFLASFNSALDESELVVFNGQVEIYGEADPSNRHLVQPQYRSGMGGRFGAGPAEPVRLTDKALKYYRSLTPEEGALAAQASSFEILHSSDSPSEGATGSTAPQKVSKPSHKAHPTPGAPTGQSGATN